jgi:hypothetical protein
MFIGRTLKTLNVSSMAFMLHFRYDAVGIGAWRSRNSFPLFVRQTRSAFPPGNSVE